MTLGKYTTHQQTDVGTNIDLVLEDENTGKIH